MTETYRLTFPGKPIAKHRPRFARRGKFVVTYSDQETEEGRFLWELKQQWKQAPLQGPIVLNADFFIRIPASLSAKKRTAMCWTPHTKKPDLDNLIKFIKDLFNNIVWVDDSQVFRIEANKYWDTDPRTDIRVDSPLEKGKV